LPVIALTNSQIRHMDGTFSVDCRRCDRLADFLHELREKYPDYHNRPVPAFGAPDARLLIVGLAPGMHGANATGRPFTGDYAGVLLYQTLFDFGFASKPEATAIDDGLTLNDCRITNAVRCLPPENKPVGAEVNQCNAYLVEDLAKVPSGGVIVALGGIAHRAVLKAQGLKLSAIPFVHAAETQLPNDAWLISSYHCSRYNTNTRRLTPDMFAAVFAKARARLEQRAA
jgi:uracil-DNA glycosylase family 4